MTWMRNSAPTRRALTPGAFEFLRSTVLDPANAFEVIPIEPAMMDHFERVPLEQLGDPFDRFILATAAYLRLPLVTKDRAVVAAGIAEIIW